MSSKGNRMVHGTLEGYKSNGCRCKKCSNTWAMYIEQYREDIFDERTAKYKEVKLSNSDIERGYGE